ncbi:hypothetical protein F4782DRAFT_535816 [Xylaria castorea]|nr:hypothetical protein F4782DRAFT_535816 [Xylaria castorea]
MGSKRDTEESPRTPRESEPSQNPPQPPENRAPSIIIRTPRPNQPYVLPPVPLIVPPEDMLRPNIRKLLKSESPERLQLVYNAYTREKRNFSQLSSTSLESSSGHKLTKMGQEIDDESSMKYHLQVVRQKLKAADAAYEAKQATIRELRASWQDGSLEMTCGQFKEETRRLEEEIGALLVEKVHMRTSTNQLAAKEVDTERWNKLAHTEDWSYIDLLASRLREPSASTATMKNPRNPDKQAHWRKAVIKAYGAESRNGRSVWCPISQRYVNLQYATAAHIVRYNVGEPAAVHLFGPLDDSDGHIWSIRNGIPLAAAYEELLDDGMIAIIPTKNGKDLMVVVLDEAMRVDPPDAGDLVPMGQLLHGRTLKFLNDHRPAMRYLYFCFAMNLLRRQRFEVDGWWKDRISYADTPFFPTPGKWVRETTLRKLAIRIGHLPTDEAGGFVATTKGSKPEDPFQEGEAAVGEEEKDDEEKDDEEKDDEEKDDEEKDDEEKDDEEKEEVFTSYLQYTYRNQSTAPESD